MRVFACASLRARSRARADRAVQISHQRNMLVLPELSVRRALACNASFRASDVIEKPLFVTKLELCKSMTFSHFTWARAQHRLVHFFS